MVPSNKLATIDLNETSTTIMPALNESLVATGTTFDWTEGQKQLILGSFFWGYIMTELPGGRLAELIGGHRVFGHSSKLKFLCNLNFSQMFFNFSVVVKCRYVDHSFCC
jgi:MFS transporter, ACS family, solute carrier family 17 (sodium-dependent inorganic phosphate cotransporter), other